MTLGQYLRLLLASRPEIAALVKTRIHTEILPQSPGVPELPAIVFNEVYGSEDVALDGPTGVGGRGLQVDSWATTRAEATTLARHVRTALDGHSGAAAGLEVQGVFFRTERWDTDTDAVPGQVLYRTSQDYDATLGGES